MLAGIANYLRPPSLDTATTGPSTGRGVPVTDGPGAGRSNEDSLNFWDAASRVTGDVSNLVNAFTGNGPSQPARASQAPRSGFMGLNLGEPLGLAALGVGVLVVGFVAYKIFKRK